jgi:hypothetical protein|tara:strand:- start:289 stop:462 length:174 start_codon:yes stop_codon:yes gene_type:complete
MKSEGKENEESEALEAIKKMFDEAKLKMKKEMGDNITDAEEGEVYIELRVVKRETLD